MAAVIPHLAELARSYDAFRTVAGVGAIRSEADHRRALALIEAILTKPATRPRAKTPRIRWPICWIC